MEAAGENPYFVCPSTTFHTAVLGRVANLIGVGTVYFPDMWLHSTNEDDDIPITWSDLLFYEKQPDVRIQYKEKSGTFQAFTVQGNKESSKNAIWNITVRFLSPVYEIQADTLTRPDRITWQTAGILGETIGTKVTIPNFSVRTEDKKSDDVIVMDSPVSWSKPLFLDGNKKMLIAYNGNTGKFRAHTLAYDKNKSQLAEWQISIQFVKFVDRAGVTVRNLESKPPPSRQPPPLPAGKPPHVRPHDELNQHSDTESDAGESQSEYDSEDDPDMANDEYEQHATDTYDYDDPEGEKAHQDQLKAMKYLHRQELLDMRRKLESQANKERAAQQLQKETRNKFLADVTKREQQRQAEQVKTQAMLEKDEAKLAKQDTERQKRAEEAKVLHEQKEARQKELEKQETANRATKEKEQMASAARARRDKKKNDYHRTRLQEENDKNETRRKHEVDLLHKQHKHDADNFRQAAEASNAQRSDHPSAKPQQAVYDVDSPPVNKLQRQSKTGKLLIPAPPDTPAVPATLIMEHSEDNQKLDKMPDYPLQPAPGHSPPPPAQTIPSSSGPAASPASRAGAFRDAAKAVINRNKLKPASKPTPPAKGTGRPGALKQAAKNVINPNKLKPASQSTSLPGGTPKKTDPAARPPSRAGVFKQAAHDALAGVKIRRRKEMPGKQTTGLSRESSQDSVWDAPPLSPGGSVDSRASLLSEGGPQFEPLSEGESQADPPALGQKRARHVNEDLDESTKRKNARSMSRDDSVASTPAQSLSRESSVESVARGQPVPRERHRMAAITKALGAVSKLEQREGRAGRPSSNKSSAASLEAPSEASSTASSPTLSRAGSPHSRPGRSRTQRSESKAVQNNTAPGAAVPTAAHAAAPAAAHAAAPAAAHAAAPAAAHAAAPAASHAPPHQTFPAPQPAAAPAAAKAPTAASKTTHSETPASSRDSSVDSFSRASSSASRPDSASKERAGSSASRPSSAQKGTASSDAKAHRKIGPARSLSAGKSPRGNNAVAFSGKSDPPAQRAPVVYNTPSKRASSADGKPSRVRTTILKPAPTKGLPSEKDPGAGGQATKSFRFDDPHSGKPGRALAKQQAPGQKWSPNGGDLLTKPRQPIITPTTNQPQSLKPLNSKKKR